MIVSAKPQRPPPLLQFVGPTTPSRRGTTHDETVGIRHLNPHLLQHRVRGRIRRPRLWGRDQPPLLRTLRRHGMAAPRRAVDQLRHANIAWLALCMAAFELAVGVTAWLPARWNRMSVIGMTCFFA